MASQRSYLDILNIIEIKAHIQAYLHKADSEKGLLWPTISEERGSCKMSKSNSDVIILFTSTTYFKPIKRKRKSFKKLKGKSYSCFWKYFPLIKLLKNVL